MKKENKKKCLCCKRDLVMFQKKYCNSCSLYTSDLRKRLYYFKKKCLMLIRKIYGQEDGTQRVKDNLEEYGNLTGKYV